MSSKRPASDSERPFLIRRREEPSSRILMFTLFQVSASHSFLTCSLQSSTFWISSKMRICDFAVDVFICMRTASQTEAIDDIDAAGMASIATNVQGSFAFDVNCLTSVVFPTCRGPATDRKSTRLNSSHQIISYA